MLLFHAILEQLKNGHVLVNVRGVEVKADLMRKNWRVRLSFPDGDVLTKDFKPKEIENEIVETVLDLLSDSDAALS